MPIRELLLLLHCCWPSLLLHCALHPLWGCIQIIQGEPQKSCSKSVAEKVTESCQQTCQCRPPPPLPPPPPPPPPPRLLVVPTPKSTFCPTEETWWPGLVIIIAVCCTTLVLLFVVVIICYKAIKRYRILNLWNILASKIGKLKCLEYVQKPWEIQMIGH
ncbi:proline-rich membrane anchor 1 isoform X1 [Emydura macquarii macquarii]|uniref:proline-rich membrane anchor 1 isoform X1 n=1 Tax=Emydura macquarii macquarii TaxID=1129001 RepID=UPI00352AB553